ncbi:MAG: hypothetical protein GF419_01895 [Ignavibacteriales bacterium]|nr:hypothetical protein [Ignavibacteriales bacterium]
MKLSRFGYRKFVSPTPRLDGAIKAIEAAAVGYLPEEERLAALARFEREKAKVGFDDEAEANFARILEAMYSPSQFLRDAARFPHYFEIVVAVAANSAFLTDVVVRNPEYLYRALDGSFLERPLVEREFAEEVERKLGAFKTFEAKMNALRSLKRRELLRVGVNDAIGNADLRRTTSELSILARSLGGAAFRLAMRETFGKRGLEPDLANVCVFSLGKLGGNELNYSSDVDLIAFYDEERDVTEKATFGDLTIEATKLFIEECSRVTERGALYRIDFRLRPDGRNAPLVRSVEDLLYYYETRGEDWERQALIRADFFCGDETLFRRFVSYLAPFVYPASPGAAPIEQLRRLRRAAADRAKGEVNVKLSDGGVRDIEFAAQALQLVFGGKNPRVRTPNTLDAIDRLEAEGALYSEEADEFRESYVFYRRVEHHLQLMNDRQTHTLPETGAALERIAKRLGFDDGAALKADVSARRRRVSKIYRSIVHDEEVVEETLDLSVVGLEDVARAETNWRFLKEGLGAVGVKKFDVKTVAAFERIETPLLDRLRRSLAPDRVLEHLARIVRAARFPSLWYERLRDEAFLDAAIRVAESTATVELFAEDSGLKDQLLSGRAFVVEEESALPPKEALFKAGVRLGVRLIEPAEFSRAVSSAAIGALRTTAEEWAEEHDTEEWFLAAMGSVATKESRFTSDVDLVFGYADAKGGDVEPAFVELLRRLEAALAPIKVDCRLRPEGKSAQLAWETDAYKNYIRTRARLWELQAHCKIEFVAGDRRRFDEVIDAVAERIAALDEETTRREMSELRKKTEAKSLGMGAPRLNLRKGVGGLADAEVVAHRALLADAERYRELRAVPLETILTTVSDGHADTARAVSTLKAIELHNERLFNASGSRTPTDARRLAEIAEAVGATSVGELRAAINDAMKTIREARRRELER